MEHGGPDWSPAQRWIFEAECARAGVPNVNVMGVKMVGPVIIGFGTAEQKNFYLPRILSGEDTGARAIRSRAPAPTSPR